MGTRRGVNTYSGAHRRVVLDRGFATEHVCPCGKPAFEWAYNHENPCPDERTSPKGRAFSTDVSRYIAMCRRCHRLFDKKYIELCPHGHKYAGENLILDAGKRKCRTCVYARNNARRLSSPMTAEQKARKLELQRIRRARERSTA